MVAIQERAINARRDWDVDPGHTTIEFSVKNFGFLTVRGRFSKVQGHAVTYGNIVDGAAIDVEIDAASIDTGIATRDEHLRAADFLAIATYPTITFHSTTVEDRGDDRFRVVGDLVVHGMRRQIVLDAAIEHLDDRGMMWTATTSVGRRDFGVGLKATHAMVGNTITVRITLALRVREPARQGETPLTRA